MGIRETIHDYGRQLEIPNLQLSDTGSVQMQLQSGAILVFEHRNEELILCLMQPLLPDMHALKIRTLQEINFRKSLPYGLQIAASKVSQQDMLMIVLRMTERNVTLPSLSHAVDFLFRWFAQISNN